MYFYFFRGESFEVKDISELFIFYVVILKIWISCSLFLKLKWGPITLGNNKIKNLEEIQNVTTIKSKSKEKREIKVQIGKENKSPNRKREIKVKKKYGKGWFIYFSQNFFCTMGHRNFCTEALLQKFLWKVDEST